jgi:hypothetical protein
MKYDPTELMKMNITEDGIQKQRDHILRCLTEYNTSKMITLIDKVYLPFIVDMLEDYTFSCERERMDRIKITITL